MAQAGLNDEKNWQSKISLDCPFKKATTMLKIYTLCYNLRGKYICEVIKLLVHSQPIDNGANKLILNVVLYIHIVSSIQSQVPSQPIPRGASPIRETANQVSFFYPRGAFFGTFYIPGERFLGHFTSPGSVLWDQRQVFPL